MSVTVPVAIPTQIGPCPMMYKTPRGIEPKLPPKPLPKRKPGYREKHIYDCVPREGSLFQKSYSPVIYHKKPIPTPPGKLSPNLLNILTMKSQEKIPEKTCEKPTLTHPDKPVLVPPDKVIIGTLSKPTQALKSDDKANGQECSNLGEQKPSPEGQIAGVTKEDGDANQASTQEESPVCQRKEGSIKNKSSSQENIKYEELDGCMPSLLESSMFKEQDAEATKNETACMFSSDHRSTTCSASSAFSSSASSNTSSESSASSIAKVFFSTPNLGSSTPKRIGSPKNFTPVENLYDSWRLDVGAKTEAGTPSASAEEPVKQFNKCSGYYTEISEYISSAGTGSSPCHPAENQAMVVPPPLQFSNNNCQTKEQVLYVNLPTRTTGLSSSVTSKQSFKDKHMEGVIVNEYVDPQDELMDVPNSNTDGSISANPKPNSNGLIQATNQYEMPLDMGTMATQTDLEMVTVSCECGEFLCLPSEMEEVVSQLKQEQKMRLVSEQLVKMVEIEVRELKEDLLAKKTELVQAMEEKQSAEGEVREATKIAAQYKVEVAELEKSLAQAKEEITKLEGRVPADGSSDSGSKEEDSDSDLEKKIAEAKDKEARNRLEVVQVELLASKDEVNRLLAHLAQATREKNDMVSSKVHKELLRMAEERTNHAEMKTLALERELRMLMEERIFSETPSSSLSGDPPEIPPRRSELKYPASSTGIRTSPRHFQKHSTLYSRGNLATRRGQPPVCIRAPAGMAAGNKRAKTQNRSWSLGRLRKAEVSKAEKEAKNEEVKDVKNSGKVSFLQRVQSRVSGAQTKAEVQNSLFDRMQRRFFNKAVKSAAPPSNCDLPDVESLEESSSRSEYEIPMEPIQRFAGTPLIVGDESAEDSDWSSEDEGSSSKRPRTNGGHRKARRGKSRKERKPKDAKSNEKQKSKSPDSREESSTTPAPSAPVSRLAEVLSSKEGLKSAALKSNARDNSSASDEADGKASEEVKNERDENGDSKTATIIKIKPPPPTAPKPRAKRTSSGQSCDNAEDKSVETKSRETAEKNPNTVTSSHESLDEGIFDGMEIAKPKLTSYKRTVGPQGRRLPQRYSNQVQSQRFSSQSTNSLATVSA